MPTPYLPPEIAAEIIHHAQPLHHSSSSYRQTVYKQLAPVASTWHGFAKEKYDQWLWIRVKSNHHTGKNSVFPTRPRNLKRVRFVEVDLSELEENDLSDSEVEDTVSALQLQNRIRKILSGCSGLEELWMHSYSDPAVGGDPTIWRLLSFLTRFPKPYFLHLSSTPGVFGGDSHQLAALRHLSLNIGGEGILDSAELRDYSFIQPQHLPSLVSLALVRLPLGNASFLSSFHQCAPQIRFLFICQHYCNNIDPWTLIAHCQNLAHLCVIPESEDLRPLSAVVTTMPLLSFTTSENSLRTDAKLKVVTQCKNESDALRNARLYVIPDNERFYKWNHKPSPEWKLLPAGRRS